MSSTRVKGSEAQRQATPSDGSDHTPSLIRKAMVVQYIDGKAIYRTGLLPPKALGSNTTDVAGLATPLDGVAVNGDEAFENQSAA